MIVFLNLQNLRMKKITSKHSMSGKKDSEFILQRLRTVLNHVLMIFILSLVF
jgi:hypothetical protein